MANKIITDDILKKATEGVIQTIADNIFEFESYNDTEIAELFSLTPEEAQNLTELINDEVISKYKLWSSKKVSDELLNAQNECNDYTDDRLSGISSISLNYCEELPDIAESNCIYILKSSDSNPDTLNLYDSDNAIWTSIGDFNISLDEYYKKLEIDTKLDLKADKTEILAQDDVITDTSLATTSNVLSATTTIGELDKKIDKTTIVTSIDSSSTDDKVPSAKAVNTLLNNKANKMVMKSSQNVDDLVDEGSYYVIEARNAPEAYGWIDVLANTNYTIQLFYPSINANCEMYIRRRQAGGAWESWKKVCTTSVADVSKTNITFTDSTYYSDITNSNHYYVINGICYVSLYFKCVTFTANYVNVCELPKAKVIVGRTLPNHGSPTINSLANIAITEGSTTLQIRCGTSGDTYYTTFSYPVAES